MARQYCGQVGKQENCRVAVSLSVSTIQASLPIAWLFIFTARMGGRPGRGESQAGVPEEVQFETKPADCPRANPPRPVDQGVPQAPVVADAGYGTDKLGSGRRLGNWNCLM